MRSVDRHVSLVEELDGFESPLDELDRRIEAELSMLDNELISHRPERVVELARIACLPWSVGGKVKPDTEGGVTKAEILALLAQALSMGEGDGSAVDEQPNSLYQAAHEWAESVGRLIELAQTRELIEVRSRPVDSLDFLAFSARSNSIWIRSSSYPDMVRTTYESLFGKQEVRTALTKHLGFDAVDAIEVLTRLHELQVDAMNERWEAGFRALHDEYETSNRGQIPTDEETRNRLRALHNRGWQPTADLVAIPAAEVATSLGQDVARVEAVLSRFAVDTAHASARDILDAFIGGDNSLRTNPVIATDRGTFMLVHDALVLPAIRENLEQELKALPEWEQYQKWRGTLLEDLGKAVLESMLPGASTYASFDYFVPVNEKEAEGDPVGYTKKVEGDILVVLDDVAIIVEAKAVAITPESRAGQTRRLRRDLTGIISKASEQASRLQKRIEGDGGVRLHQTGWLDLSHIREIHTVALSLEDLSGVATATSDLVAAGLLEAERIPWVVSIHDLQLIARLVDRPAEFLLYLRRRRDPEVSLAYAAPDELDLFLYFYEAGLYVAPDPEVMAAELPYITAPSAKDVRRRKQQGRSIIASRTDPLDAWHYSELDPERPRTEKPTLTGSPMIAFVDELRTRGAFGWLSTGATLLSASTKSQADMARIPGKLLASPDPNGRERTQAVPIGTRLSNAWLLVWITKPAHHTLTDIAELASNYLRAKKYQLKFSRGAAFIFDQETKELVEVVYDGTIPAPDPEMDRAIAGLFPPDKVSPPRPSERKPATRRKNKKRRRR
ncbi:preprotein translocase subunit SecA [Microbacterium suaedae]|uniref:preprotein translocase subunit SecA n=1 Tax=Microbacterium suaedae TaxID=2067813 RepID=UPI000DA16AE2|nr:preprotein translocase subunit SecA [Microbacterium suaedae]